MTDVMTFNVFPLRFSSDPPAMIKFLRTLGMADVVTTDGDGFAELRAGAGRVMVHGAEGSDSNASPGTTDLCLQVPSVDDAAAGLERLGLEVRVWDESYGRQAAVVGPMGESIAINEEQTDLHGYRGHDGDSDLRLVVTAVRPSTDFAADTHFFGQLGFVPDAGGDQWWQGLRGPGGVIGLHMPGDEAASRDAGSPFGRSATMRLGFETTEKLGELAARLVAAGHDARLVEEHGIGSVRLSDPDGCHLEIHSSPTHSP